MADSASNISIFNAPILGRDDEKKLLQKVIDSSQSELVAIIGRRRIGKTFLIKNYYQKFDFFCTAIHNAEIEMQLENFSLKLSQYGLSKKQNRQNENWLQAFKQLELLLDSKRSKRKKIVFIDELPWMDTPKSNFVDALAHFWNDYAVHSNVALIICGSAASWMIKKIVENKGGLHNRITQLIKLNPFSLLETERFLKSKGIVYDRYDIAKLYMINGGVPHYLNELEKGLSLAQNIDKIWFTKSSILYKEFDVLFSSLFSNSENHVSIVRALATKRKGLTRLELLKLTKLSDGGSITKVLMELEAATFIEFVLPFGKTKKDMLYRLSDSYTLFYLQFIEKHTKATKTVLQHLQNTPEWNAWCGYAFENLCLMHLDKIKQKLGIASIYTETSSFAVKGNKEKLGFQIDLLIDRADRVINICEMKFYDAPFTITKDYANKLRLRVANFRETTKTKKNLFLTMVSTYGLAKNEYASSLVQNQVVLDDLF
jgi:uncharacterized protein